MVGLPDFEWAARHHMNESTYNQYRYGAAGEWSYRNNLEVYQRFRFRPRVMVDITGIESTMNTTILGHNFSSPIFISPCAMAALTHPDAESSLVEAAANQSILYINEALFRRIEDNGFKAMVLTVDSAGDRTRHRALRYVPDTTVVRDVAYRRMTWDFYQELQNLTSLPIIPKGIQTVEDARRAVDAGAPAIFLSNHGGRALDGSPSALEVAIEIHEEDPSIFREIEVYADGGVRYGTDVLKLLALGVRAVGVGRPMMFANVYGMEGVSRAIHLLKAEIASAAAGLGVADLAAIDSRSVKLRPNGWYS
ncbi:putative cytochrome mitochondrial precursor protein [Eutypa lata UCREL1]|uniref:Putative cytochrome mitochondrial protein n=1 Tax=Eutypa lata (strain UCR-EL1) TaxID=1287681 RepID=M7SF13_EUTLA|nr:putative cytochrome mitochondrial precursor protein [Eutypa lata UCREL1]